MKLISLLKKVLACAGIRVERIYPPDPDPVDLYFQMGCPAWSNGYCVHKDRSIRRVLADPDTLALFREGLPLPDGYGYGLDERIVEYPWLLANLADRGQAVFDAGSAMNHDFVVTHPKMSNKRLTIMTLSPENQCYWQHGVSYLFGDLRSIPLQDGLFDAIVSVSTLEHIGFDNTLFSPDAAVSEVDDQAYLRCLSEMHRLLKLGGRLYLTVPFGVAAGGQTFQIFNPDRIRELEAAWPGTVESERYYLYNHHGWNVSNLESCRNAEYVDWFMRLPGDRPAVFPKQTDGATAARAVAMVMLAR